MELRRQFLGEFKPAHGGDGTDRKNGKIHIAFRAGTSLGLRTESIQRNKVRDCLSREFDQYVVVQTDPPNSTSSGYWFGRILSIERP